MLLSVMVINQETKAMDGYAISNEQGKFQISLKANSTYQIKVSFLGFQSQNIELVTGTENIRKVFALKEGGMMLDGVEVVQEMPVTISGDTIIYNADSFKTGTEQKLEDILKKLPGVQVNEDGEIEVEGRKVTQLLVEGNLSLLVGLHDEVNVGGFKLKNKGKAEENYSKPELTYYYFQDNTTQEALLACSDNYTDIQRLMPENTPTDILNTKYIFKHKDSWVFDAFKAYNKKR